MVPADLFAALAGIPRLPGARCVGLFAAFDPPELGEPRGVVAGQRREWVSHPSERRNHKR
jgi:hypothetical protein